MPELINVEKARAELDQKDLLTIERETALTWGGRAAASYDLSTEGSEAAERMRCFWEGETYRGEAVEHAAMTEDAPFLQRILAEVEAHRTRARQALLAEGHTFLDGNRTPGQGGGLPSFNPPPTASRPPSTRPPQVRGLPRGPDGEQVPAQGTQRIQRTPSLGQRPAPRH